MSRLGFKSVVYHGDLCLGELDTIPIPDQNFQFPNNEIRIHHISQQSERCTPLAILQTISSFSVRCKLESSPSPPFSSSLPLEQQSHLVRLHALCFREFKVSLSIALRFLDFSKFPFLSENVANFSWIRLVIIHFNCVEVETMIAGNEFIDFLFSWKFLSVALLIKEETMKIGNEINICGFFIYNFLIGN